MKPLADLLEASAALHRHLCPRQVLGVRMGILAGEVLGLDLPQVGKRLLTIVETDGCTCDGISVTTGCWVGRRTMRIEDYGKVAATFVDTLTGRAVRIAPRVDVRQRAHVCVPEARNKWEEQLLGYQCMPADELLAVQAVQLKTPIRQIVSRAGVKAVCEICGEEIINERESVRGGTTLCQACTGQAYYYIPLTLPVLQRQPHAAMVGD